MLMEEMRQRFDAMTKENLVWCNGSQKYISPHLCEDGLNCEECEYYSEESDDDWEVE